VATDARAVALRALERIDQGAYANLMLPPLLEQSGLERRDRDFVTELVYGTTRMRRACDWLIDRHLKRAIDDDVRRALRLGTYQLRFLSTPPHAAVSATVNLMPQRLRGFVNAILRRVAENLDIAWPDRATELSYPDWIVERLTTDLGAAVADAALVAMDAPATVTMRADGYVQNPSSQMVAELVEAGADDVVVDLCAGPGGKATAMDGHVLALDIHAPRATLIAQNAARYGHANVQAVRADGRRPPVRDAIADRVLVDAPCSGLGVLGRRADARWRMENGAVDALAQLQRELLTAAVALITPGGLLVYSACTMTAAETTDIDDWLAAEFPSFTALAAPGEPWEPIGRGGRLLPQAAGTDGMYLLRLRAP
jgi:16S rRNA (cytosine967-C5)-methyltransferase